MTCAVIEFLGNVNEGQGITINYTLKDEEGEPLTSVDTLEYKLSDGTNVLTDWTALPAVAPSGSFSIPSSKNINAGGGLIDRYLTVHSILSGKNTFKSSKYSLIEDPNVSVGSP